MENTFEEDYPELCKEKETPKPIWIQKYCVDIDGHICGDLHFSVNTNDMDEIGNLFDTKEEAEKAAEKLKAWKRLKAFGFRFIGKSCEYKPDKNFGSVFFETRNDILSVYNDCVEFYDDLDLLFGGEE